MAIGLARIFDGEVISADSRQVYRGMDLGTGKVTKAEQRQARHWLLDVASPRRQYTAAQWRRDAKRAITSIVSSGKLPIIAGGTGFYIDGLLYGAGFPEVKPDPLLRSKLDKKTTEQLFTELKKKDPRRAKTIDRHNRRRLIRALEIIRSTGEPVPKLRENGVYEVLYLAVDIPMKTLRGRIETRLATRLKGGMVAEVRRLHTEGVSWRRLENFGLEYRWVARFLQKKISRSDMRDSLLRDIFAYARRQMTWWRKNEDIQWIKNSTQAKKLARKFLS